jgi:uncharacterized protein (DUF4415 family)
MAEAVSKSFRRGSRSERLARERLARNLSDLMTEESLIAAVKVEVPEAWQTLEEDVDCREVQERVTLRLDRSVVQFYRAMGRGYQRRINRVLATYAQLRIAKVYEAIERMEVEDPMFATAYRALMGMPPRE